MMLFPVLGILPLTIAAYTDCTTRQITWHSLALFLMLGTLSVLAGWQPWYAAAAGLAAVGVPLLLCALVLDGGRGIGGGDVKLCGAVGLLLGPLAGYAAIAIALAVLLLAGKLRRAPAMPLAPFLLVGYCLTLILIWR